MGDPCSVGVSAVLIGQTDKVYLEAASREVDYVVNIAPPSMEWGDFSPNQDSRALG